MRSRRRERVCFGPDPNALCVDFVRVRNQREHGVGQNRVGERASRLCYRNRGSRDERWRVLFFLPRRRGDTFSFCVGALRHIQGWRISSSTAIRFDEFFFRRQKRQEEQRRGREKRGEAFQQNGGMYTVREANEAIYRHRAPVRNRQSTFRR